MGVNGDFSHVNCRYQNAELFKLQDLMARTMWATVRGGYVDHAWDVSEPGFEGMPEVSEADRAFYTRMAYVAIEVMRKQAPPGPYWRDVRRCSNGCNWHPCSSVGGCSGQARCNIYDTQSCVSWWDWGKDAGGPNPCTEAK